MTAEETTLPQTQTVSVSIDHEMDGHAGSADASSGEAVEADTPEIQFLKHFMVAKDDWSGMPDHHHNDGKDDGFWDFERDDLEDEDGDEGPLPPWLRPHDRKGHEHRHHSHHWHGGWPLSRWLRPPCDEKDGHWPHHCHHHGHHHHGHHHHGRGHEGSWWHGMDDGMGEHSKHPMDKCHPEVFLIAIATVVGAAVWTAYRRRSRSICQGKNTDVSVKADPENQALLSKADVQ